MVQRIDDGFYDPEFRGAMTALDCRVHSYALPASAPPLVAAAAPSTGSSDSLPATSPTSTTVKLVLWHLPARLYECNGGTIRRCLGAFLLYDVNSRESFDALPSCLEPIEKEHGARQIPITVVGTKIDAPPGQREVEAATGKKFADSIGASFIEVSAITGKNIDVALRGMVEAILAKSSLNAPGATRESGVKLPPAGKPTRTVEGGSWLGACTIA